MEDDVRLDGFSTIRTGYLRIDELLFGDACKTKEKAVTHKICSMRSAVCLEYPVISAGIGLNKFWKA